MLQQLIEDTVEQPRSNKNQDPHGLIKRGPSPPIAIVNQNVDASSKNNEGSVANIFSDCQPGDDPVSLEENELHMATTSHQVQAIEAPSSVENSRPQLVEKPASAAKKTQITKNDQIVFKGNKVFLAEKADQSIAEIDQQEIDIKEAKDIEKEKEDAKHKDKEETKVINYETFESSSEEEFSVGAFESAANSFAGKSKKEENLSGYQEQKRIER